MRPCDPIIRVRICRVKPKIAETRRVVFVCLLGVALLQPAIYTIERRGVSRVTNETISQRIRRRRIELGLSPDYVAKAIGRSRAQYYRYETSDVENMPVRLLKPLARVLRTTEAWILTGYDEAKTKRIPVLGDVAAGEPMYAAEQYGEYVEIGSDGIHVDFCVRVRGDSMIDVRIRDGDLVFVRRQPVVQDGEIAVVLIDDAVTLKRVYSQPDGIILKAENPMYPPIYISAEDARDVRVLGKAVMFQSML